MSNKPNKQENQLEVIVRDSGLESAKAQCMFDTFQDYFKIAADWEKKAKEIVVTDASQKMEMGMARAGRLFLREKRIAIEHARKTLKEQALREGKAIDGIANILKALIVPLEEYLEKQEKFVEIKAAEEAKKIAEKMKLEAECKEIEEREAAEKARCEEEARIRAENEQMREEAEAREKQMVVERAEMEAKRKAAEDKSRKEREEAEKRMAIERAKLEAEKKAEQIKREEAETKLKKEIQCPFCHKKFIPEQ